MRSTASIILALGWAATTGAEVIDRVMAAVGQQVVTLSAVRRHLRITAMVAGAQPDLSPESLRRAANRLVEHAIVQREMEITRYAMPPMSEVDIEIARYMKERNLTPEQLKAALARYGFNEDDFKKEVQWRLSVQRFVDFRFAPGVQVSDAEVEEYYAGEFAAELRKRDPKAVPPPMDDVRDNIVRVLALRKTNAALDRWLEQTRETLKVRFFEEAFQP